MSTLNPRIRRIVKPAVLAATGTVLLFGLFFTSLSADQTSTEIARARRIRPGMNQQQAESVMGCRAKRWPYRTTNGEGSGWLTFGESNARKEALREKVTDWTYGLLTPSPIPFEDWSVRVRLNRVERGSEIE